MRWLHRHRDPNWRLVDGNVYEQCRCGARRTTRNTGPGQVSLTAAGWPSTYDRHGVRRRSSGWVTEPAAGWKFRSYPTTRIKVEPRTTARPNPTRKK